MKNGIKMTIPTVRLCEETDEDLSFLGCIIVIGSYRHGICGAYAHVAPAVFAFNLQGLEKFSLPLFVSICLLFILVAWDARQTISESELT